MNASSIAIPDKFKHSEKYKLASSWLNSLTGRIFLYLVVIPSLLTFLYLYLIAPDRYISVSHVSVYDSSVTQASNDLFSSLGIDSGQSNSDLQLLRSYLQSPEILRLAEQKLNVKDHFKDSRDFLFGLKQDAAFEDFQKFYLKRAYAEVSTDTGLLTITTEAYTPDFALSLNRFLVSEGERVINQLNQNVAASEMAFAEEEMARSLKLFHDAQSQLAEFQTEKNLTSPESEGESIISIVYTMEASLAEAKAQLSETLTYLSPDSPQARSLNAKIGALEEQIEEQKARVLNSTDNEKAISQLSIEYNDLLFKVELAKIIYETAVNSYELSRSQSSKQLKHLLVPSAPIIPEKAALPDRGYWFITLTLLYIAIFAIVRIIIRSIQEHMD